MVHYMNIAGKWWELYDKKGNLITLCLVASHTLDQAIRFFTDYLRGLGIENPELREYTEMFTQED